MTGVFTLLRTDWSEIPCLSAVGELGPEALAPLVRATSDLLEDATERATLDLTAVTALSEASIAVISATFQIATRQGVIVQIASSPAVRAAFHAAGYVTDS